MMSRKNHVDDLWIYDDDDGDENLLRVGGASGLEFDMDAIMAGLGDVRSDHDDASSLADYSAYDHYAEVKNAPKSLKPRSDHVDSDTESLYNSSTGGTDDDDGAIYLEDRIINKQDDLAKLFQRMESQTRWGEVSAMLRMTPSLSFEFHYGTEVDEEGSYYKRLPLHHACRWNAPSPVLHQLLLLNPGAASTRDAYSGVLPIHLACRYGRLSAVHQLLALTSLEDVINMAQQTDDMGRLPLHWACRYGGTNSQTAALPTKLLLKLLQAYPAAVTQRDRSRCKTPMHYASEHPLLSRNKELLAHMLKVRAALSKEQQRTLLMDKEPQATEHDDDGFSMSLKDEEDEYDVIPIDIYDRDLAFITPKNERDEFDVIPAHIYVKDDAFMDPKNTLDEFDVIPANLYIEGQPSSTRQRSSKKTSKWAAALDAARKVNTSTPPRQRWSSPLTLPRTPRRSNRNKQKLARSRGAAATTTTKPPSTAASGITFSMVSSSWPLTCGAVVDTAVKSPPPPPPPPPPPTRKPPTSTQPDRISSDESSTRTGSAPEKVNGRHQPGSPRSVMDMMGGPSEESGPKQVNGTKRLSAAEAASSPLAYPPGMITSSSDDDETVSEGDHEVVKVTTNKDVVPMPKVAVREESVPKVAVREESVPKVAVPKETARKVVVPKETTPKVAGPKESSRKVVVPKETTPKVACPKETARKVVVPKETMPKVAVPKETARKVVVPKETMPKVAVRKETARKVAVPKETVPKVVIPKGAARKVVVVPKETTTSSKPNRRIYYRREGKIESTVEFPGTKEEGTAASRTRHPYLQRAQIERQDSQDSLEA